jgi:hypothetical protein
MWPACAKSSKITKLVPTIPKLLKAYPEDFCDEMSQLRPMLRELEKVDKWWQTAYDERF